MPWPDHAIWWQVYPLGFLGAERSARPVGVPPVPRLRALEPWLGYLVKLGCNGLALGPVFASETHGYDIVDYFSVDPRLGTEADLLWLVGQARARGVRVLLDGVFNHVGRSFPAFTAAAAAGPGTRLPGWFRTSPQTADGYHTFEGHHRLVTLNHRATATVSHLTSTALAYTVTGHRAGDCLAVALSTSDQPVKVSLPAGSWALEAGTAQFGPDQALVPPAGWAIASSPQTGR